MPARPPQIHHEIASDGLRGLADSAAVVRDAEGREHFQPAEAVINDAAAERKVVIDAIEPINDPLSVQRAGPADGDALLPIQNNSEVVEGNLLTLPVGGGLLYVQPVYALRPSGEGTYPVLRFVLALAVGALHCHRHAVGVPA